MPRGTSLERRAGAALDPATAQSAFAAWTLQRPTSAECKLVAALTRVLCAWLSTDDDSTTEIAALLVQSPDHAHRHTIYRAAAHAACYKLYARQPGSLGGALARLDVLESSVFPDARAIFPLGRPRSM